MARTQAKKQRAQALEDSLNAADRTREAAIRGGFNPLTYLHATGGAAQASLPTDQISLISPGDMSRIFGTIGDELSGDAARRRAATDASTRLDNIRADEIRAGFDRPVRVGSPVTRSNALAAASGGILGMTGLKAGQVTGYVQGGRKVNVDPTYEDTEVVEKRGGELGAFLHSIPLNMSDYDRTYGVSDAMNKYLGWLKPGAAHQLGASIRARGLEALREYRAENGWSAPVDRPRARPEFVSPQPASPLKLRFSGGEYERALQ